MIKLYLFRHGETDWNKENKMQSRADNLLNSKGLEQAKITAQILKDKNIEHIYSSPLKRAIQTADALKNIVNIDIEIIEDLAESDLSVFDGLNIDLFEERIKNGYYKKITGTDNFLEAMGCESDEHIKKRIFNAILTICKKTPYKTIAISSHGNILKKLLIQCNFPDTSKLSNCEIIEAEFNDGKLKIIKRIK